MQKQVEYKKAGKTKYPEPVVFVNHQIKANWTSWLPNKEIAWPVQMVKNGKAHLAEGLSCAAFSITHLLRHY